MRRMIGIVGALAIAACSGGASNTDIFGGDADDASNGGTGGDSGSGDVDSSVTDASIDAPSDSPAQVCVPGQSIACVGPGGCQGGQVCLPDGQGFGSCHCSNVVDASDDAADSADDLDAAPDASDASDASDAGDYADAGQDPADATPPDSGSLPTGCEPPGLPEWRRYCTEACGEPYSGWTTCDRVCEGDYGEAPSLAIYPGVDRTIIFPPVAGTDYGCSFCDRGVRWSWTAKVANGNCVRITTSPDRLISAKPGMLNHTCGDASESHCIAFLGGNHTDFPRFTVTAKSGAPIGWIRIESDAPVDGQCQLKCP